MFNFKKSDLFSKRMNSRRNPEEILEELKREFFGEDCIVVLCGRDAQDGARESSYNFIVILDDTMRAFHLDVGGIPVGIRERGYRIVGRYEGVGLDFCWQSEYDKGIASGFAHNREPVRF